jgi:drug/metabolite transporter (DMT)-like permease
MVHVDGKSGQMGIKDFSLVVFVCVIWALQFVISKIILADMAIPPMFFTMLRFGLVALVALPWLLPAPASWPRTAVVCFLIGGGAFAAFVLGLKTVTPSSAAIVYQLTIPLTALLSVVLLREAIDRRRGTGIILTVVGAFAVMWDPAGWSFSFGLLLVALSALIWSLGAVMIKQGAAMPVMQFQAWVGASAVIPLAIISLLTEKNQVGSAITGGWALVAAIIFSAIVVTILGHGIYYRLVRKYDASLIAPLMIMNPMLTVVFGVLITEDVMDLQMTVGMIIALLGVVLCTVQTAPRSKVSVGATSIE